MKTIAITEGIITQGALVIIGDIDLLFWGRGFRTGYITESPASLCGMFSKARPRLWSSCWQRFWLSLNFRDSC
jgi:hypothetical protein